MHPSKYYVSESGYVCTLVSDQYEKDSSKKKSKYVNENDREKQIK